MAIVYINDKVKVKLTKVGIAIIEKRRNELIGKVPFLPVWKEPKKDENGYTTFQLWEFMNIFGPEMVLENSELPFEDRILV